MDSQSDEAMLGRLLSYTHDVFPAPPVSADGDLCILLDADSGGVDRLSRLPDELLCDIVSRLSIKDAARTAVLSRRWSPIWRAAPLVLVDTHLLQAGDDNHLYHAHSDAVAAAVSRILVTHPGPFRCVRLACSCTGEDRALVERWLELLASKGVQELLLIKPLSLGMTRHLPATFFSMTVLTRLYLGLSRFPDTAALPRGASFPRLRELGLCSTIIDSSDMDFVLATSPVLEILNIMGYLPPPLRLRLRIISRTLRCVRADSSAVDSITALDAPSLEELIFGCLPNEDRCYKIKISNAPALRIVGALELGKNELQVGNTIIKAGTVVNPSVMLPAVTMLVLHMRFGVCSDSKMLPTILRCFPNVERLLIRSKKTTESTGKLDIKFWKESGAIKCITSSISMLYVQDFRGERNELAFLKFFMESAQMLKLLVIKYADGCVSSRDEAYSKVKVLLEYAERGRHCEVAVIC